MKELKSFVLVTVVAFPVIVLMLHRFLATPLLVAIYLTALYPSFVIILSLRESQLVLDLPLRARLWMLAAVLVGVVARSIVAS